MRFSRTSQRLAELKNKNDLSVSEVLNFFDDICNDVLSDQGTDLWKLSLGDGDEAVLGLSRTANLIRRIYREQSMELETMRSFRRWEAASSRLKEAEPKIEELRQQIGQYEKETARIEQTLSEFSDAQKLKKELEEELQRKRELLTECTGLQEQIRQKEEETREIRRSRLPELKRQYEQAKERYGAAAGELQELESEVARQRERHSEEEKRYRSLEQCRDSLKEQTAEFAAEEKKLSEEISRLEAEKSELKERIESGRSSLPELVSIAADYSEQLKTFQLIARKLDETDARLRDDASVFRQWFESADKYEKMRALFSEKLETAGRYINDCLAAHKELREILEKEYLN